MAWEAGRDLSQPVAGLRYSLPVTAPQSIAMNAMRRASGASWGWRSRPIPYILVLAAV